ncbi:MAG TPA: tRNA 2-selenouridine(34) synthase MnmH, partial [Burkholderiaceae bacterium]|nr:tRNA 2-selenouridine(34) synthase MnmH [Burkholderiaceae bacterium]
SGRRRASAGAAVSLRIAAAAEVVAALREFDALIDVRSPAEFAEDHLPGALNWPVLDDEERRHVGTLYVRDSPLSARKVGAAMVARHIAAHIERWVQGKPREWRPLVYCWRGGQRSLALAWFLDQIGFRTVRLQGGYKAFRAQVRAELAALPAALQLTVIAGRTGSGKTRLLHALAAHGAQVLDLEALACHRGSVLGGLPDTPQPSQKAFDTALWQALRGFDANRPVFVESESRRVGALQLPDALVARMREHARCVRVRMDDAARVQLLLQEYGHFAGAPERFCELLAALTELQGKERVARWQAMARAAQWAELFGELMREHYDPLYERSMRRNFVWLAASRELTLADGGDAALQAAARELAVAS